MRRQLHQTSLWSNLQCGAAGATRQLYKEAVAGLIFDYTCCLLIIITVYFYTLHIPNQDQVRKHNNTRTLSMMSIPDCSSFPAVSCKQVDPSHVSHFNSCFLWVSSPTTPTLILLTPSMPHPCLCLITSLKTLSCFKQFEEQDLDSLLIIPMGPI